jgi:hypothetical protein
MNTFSLISSLPLAYIDPGTGSILFSILMGLAAALFFLAKTLWIKIKFLFSGKAAVHSSRHFPLVIYSEDARYWNVFKPILEECESRCLALRYLSSDQNDPFFNNTYAHITGEYIGSGNRAFAYLNLLEADICLMTTPGLEVYQLKRSRGVKHYAHIVHDTGDTTCYKLFGVDWFDSVLLSGEYQIEGLRRLEEIRGLPQKELVVVGCPYLDVFAEKIKDQYPQPAPDSVTVLVSPSWGPNSLLPVYGEKLIDPLIQTGWKIILRPHPQSRISDAEILQRLEARYKDNPNIEWDHNPENLPSLARSHVMISDFSGIIFDFAFLFQRPVLYTVAQVNMDLWDASDLDTEPWKFTAVRSLGLEITPETLSQIPQLVEKVLTQSSFKEGALQARDTAWQYRGEAGKRTVDFLQKKLAELHTENTEAQTLRSPNPRGGLLRVR